MAGAAFFGLAKDGYGAFSNGWGEIPSSFHGKHGNMEGQRMFPQSAFFRCVRGNSVRISNLSQSPRCTEIAIHGFPAKSFMKETCDK
jgi:hypothetical protein